MRTNGTFIIWGDECAPQVHTLTRDELKGFRERERICGGRESAHWREAMRLTFGRDADGATIAIPAWQDACLELFALEYVGAWQTEVRGIAAALLLGHAVGGDAVKRRPGTGGCAARVPTPEPAPLPTGGAS